MKDTIAQDRYYCIKGQRRFIAGLLHKDVDMGVLHEHKTFAFGFGYFCIFVSLSDD